MLHLGLSTSAHEVVHASLFDRRRLLAALKARTMCRAKNMSAHLLCGFFDSAARRAHRNSTPNLGDQMNLKIGVIVLIKVYEP